MLPLAPEGYPFILAPAAAGLVVWAFGYPAPAVVLWVAALLCIAFFRDPSRESPTEPGVIVAPADGKVLSVGEAPRALADRGLPRQVSIFMSPANVHVNRAPIGGTAGEVRYTPGKKLPAFRDKASELNEHSFVVLTGHEGSVAYKQIAGSIARRVVCDVEQGQSVERGQRVGLIKFSSRVDLFLPQSATVTISPGQRTRAGVTIVARFGAPGRA